VGPPFRGDGECLLRGFLGEVEISSAYLIGGLLAMARTTIAGSFRRLSVIDEANGLAYALGGRQV
jgi:hypothetical protein